MKSDPVGTIREVLIAAVDMVPVGDEPYVGWSVVLAERIAAALGLDDLDAFIGVATEVIADGQLVGSEPAEAWQPVVRDALTAALKISAGDDA